MAPLPSTSRTKATRKTQYIIFTDSDEDDTMAITIMAIQQALYGDVEIAGIVVEDGFLGIDQGLRWLSYWMQTLFPQLQIPLVRGYPREPYLNETRYFPLPWVADYTGLLDTYYPAWTTSAAPTPESPEAFLNRLLGSSSPKGVRYHILNIGPTTTLPKLLELYPTFAQRAVYGASDLGSIRPHMIYPSA
jgi:inosine-uridine nucleoside N-ribohydrolase